MAGICTPCVGGTYSTTVNASSSSLCLNCDEGRYSNPGATSCIGCWAGTYSGSGAPSCTDCNAMTYSTTVNATSVSTCLTCPTDTYSDPGATVCTGCPSDGSECTFPTTPIIYTPINLNTVMQNPDSTGFVGFVNNQTSNFNQTTITIED